MHCQKPTQRIRGLEVVAETTDAAFNSHGPNSPPMDGADMAINDRVVTGK
jgi:hypothetical protein